jgi:hypothetical protein
MANKILALPRPSLSVHQRSLPTKPILDPAFEPDDNDGLNSAANNHLNRQEEPDLGVRFRQRLLPGRNEKRRVL